MKPEIVSALAAAMERALDAHNYEHAYYLQGSESYEVMAQAAMKFAGEWLQSHADELAEIVEAEITKRT